MKRLLEHYSKMYYEGNPVISDSQYDALVDKYGELRTVGYSLDRGIPHFYKMYSLQKYYVGEDTPDLGDDVIITPKMDGAAISLLYIDGLLVQALTRGDGELGIDISSRLVSIEVVNKLNIPVQIFTDHEIVQIDGEILAPKTIENSRNYAAGSLSLKDREEFLTRDLIFCAYSVRPNIHSTYLDDLGKLIFSGFMTVENIDSSMYPTDGEVHRVNSNEKYVKAGYTSKYPRGAFALKRRNEGVITTILGVEWQTGKSGKVTPVAILDPIKIDGALVSRATLNNVDFINALGVGIGDRVRVERAGNIIPRIIEKVDD